MKYTLSEMARIIELIEEELKKDEPDMEKLKGSLANVKESLVARSRDRQMELGL